MPIFPRGRPDARTGTWDGFPSNPSRKRRSGDVICSDASQEGSESGGTVAMSTSPVKSNRKQKSSFLRSFAGAGPAQGPSFTHRVICRPTGTTKRLSNDLVHSPNRGFPAIEAQSARSHPQIGTSLRDRKNRPIFITDARQSVEINCCIADAAQCAPRQVGDFAKAALRAR
jgi:hypothetical protein